MNRHSLVWGLVLAVMLLASAAHAQPDRLEQMWWNDSLIVDDLGLSKAQRQQMDAAYQRYWNTTEPLRREAVSQRPYLQALEAGDWKAAKKASDEWLAASQKPIRAMIELKLAVLPLLTSKQRETVAEKYPRLIRRNWNPRRR